MRYLTILFLFLSLIACGSSSDEEEIIDAITGEEMSEETMETNPIAMSTQFFGQNGNLWKPEADPTSAGAGLLVILLSASFTEQFDSCEITNNAGETVPLVCINDQPFTQIPFSCFSNGNRQTWRAPIPCEQVGAVRAICRSFNQEVTFTVPEAQRGQVCSRFG